VGSDSIGVCVRLVSTPYAQNSNYDVMFILFIYFLKKHILWRFMYLKKLCDCTRRMMVKGAILTSKQEVAWNI
jgi:hypothetical protein